MTVKDEELRNEDEKDRAELPGDDEDEDLDLDGDEEGEPGPPQKKAAVDWSKVDPGEIPMDVIHRTSAFQGLLADKQGAALERNAYRKQVEMMEAAKADSGSPFALEGDPDDEITKAEAVKLMQGAYGDILSRLDRMDDETRIGREEASIARAREAYAAGKVAGGLEFDSVLAEGLPELVRRQGQGYVDALRRSNDPGEALYQAVISASPKLAARQKAAHVAGTLDKLKGGGGGSPRGGGRGSGSRIDNLSKASDSQLEKLIEKYG